MSPASQAMVDTIGSETGCGAECKSGKLVKGPGWSTFDKDVGCFCMKTLVKVIQKVPMVGWS